MAQLPLKLPLDQMQARWKSQLDPVLGNPLIQGRQLPPVTLVAGLNYIQHGLGRPLLGWIIVDRNAAVNVHSEQPSNPSPSLNLILVAAGTVTVSLWVY